MLSHTFCTVHIHGQRSAWTQCIYMFSVVFLSVVVITSCINTLLLSKPIDIVLLQATIQTILGPDSFCFFKLVGVSSYLSFRCVSIFVCRIVNSLNTCIVVSVGTWFNFREPTSSPQAIHEVSRVKLLMCWPTTLKITMLKSHFPMFHDVKSYSNQRRIAMLESVFL